MESASDLGSDTPRYRSGTVARLLRMPVSTLRVWERRYAVVAPPVSDGGHRLYREADVARLQLLKHLVDEGHSIGLIAKLSDAQLREAAGRPATVASAGALRVVAVGSALLPRWTSAQSAVGTDDLVLQAACADLREAEQLSPAQPTGLLLLQMPALSPAHGERILKLVERLQPARTLLLYGYAASTTLDVLREQGLDTVREPVGDAELAEQLRRCRAALMPAAPAVAAEAVMNPPLRALAAAHDAGEQPPPRRYDDTVLARVAAHSSTIACECPRHVAELLMQLTAFEAYSEACTHRNDDDARLHAELARVTGRARAMFEQALERIAAAEGISLPPAAAA